ncbi:MAG: SCO family protein [Flexibacteraceae bacterium]
MERFRDVEGNPTKYLLNEDGQPHKLPPFSFTDQDGKTITEKDIEGKVVIADYIFTRCQTICPKMSSNLESVQRAFADNPNVVLLSHTVDPEYDTVQVLNSYAKVHGAISGKWHFLTGEKEKLYKQASEGYKIVASEEASGPDAFVHSDRIVLLDRNGYIRGYYNGTDSMQIDTLILETKIVLSELK